VSEFWKKLVFSLLFTLFASANAHATRPGSDSQPLLFLPFEYGTQVHCVQSPGGTYSHQGSQYYSYDYDMGNTSNSRSNPIFGVDLLSPVNGTITEIRVGVQDFNCNSEASTCNNYGWGNTMVIQADHSDYFIRFAHMREYSIPSYLSVGSHLDQGDLIGEVGQTGFSSHPHLHIQVQTKTRGSSLKFEFVEGHVTSGTWIESQLEPHKYILDNDRRTNLGAPIENPNNWYTGSFSLYRVGGNAHGDDYRRSYSGATGDQRFYWAFTPVNYSGEIDVYANCRLMSTNDDQAQYRIYGSGISLYETVNQTQQPSTVYWPLDRIWVRTAYRYTVRVRRVNASRRLCADSIVLYFNDE